jgi:hypothetical protein
MSLMRRAGVSVRNVLTTTFTVAVLVAFLAACASPSVALNRPHPASGGAAAYTGRPVAPVLKTPYTKMMVIAEENEEASSVIGSSNAPYINKLAATYGQATNMQAGYDVACPSLAAYILLTSGDTQKICDDAGPADHPLAVDNVFQQARVAGAEWRSYGESAPQACQQYNTPDGLFLVRHTPAPYYTNQADICQGWDQPLGTTTSGALHSDLASGLPAYSFVTPNACNDMHGAASCRTNLVRRGDDWLAQWMPQIIASPDFQQSRLVVVITWDEGSSTSNHIATVVVGRTIRGVKSTAALTHCSTLRAAEELLAAPLLGCAQGATSLREAFGF